MSDLYESLPGQNDSVPPWKIKPVIINLDSDDEDSDDEDSSGLPGRSKATTDLSSCSNTAIQSSSQNSLSSFSNTSIPVAALEQNVKATTGAADDKQAIVVIDLTQDSTDDTTSRQSDSIKASRNTTAISSPTSTPTSSSATFTSSLKAFYEHRPLVPQTSKYGRINGGYSGKNAKDVFGFSCDGNSMETSDVVAAVCAPAVYGVCSAFDTNVTNRTARQYLPMDMNDSSEPMEARTYSNANERMEMAMDISRPLNNIFFNTFGLNNNSRACEEELMDIDERQPLFTPHTTPPIVWPVYRNFADYIEPMDTDECIRHPNAFAHNSSIRVKVRKRKMNDSNEDEMSYKRRKF